MVLDLTPGRLSDAIIHAEKALESVLKRIQALKDGLNGNLVPVPVAVQGEDKKGKGKAVSPLVARELVQSMSKNQMEGELQELEGVKEDLALKVGRISTQSYAFLSFFSRSMSSRLRPRRRQNRLLLWLPEFSIRN